MGFYEQISRYYDYIFPVEEDQVSFIMSAAGPSPARLLDVACGTGGYVVRLSRLGYKVAAADLDGAMVDCAVKKAEREQQDIDVYESNMLFLDKNIKGHFKCIYCIGNSIVHLGSKGAITAALRQMYKLLEEEGALVIQIINFDRIFTHHISGLPALYNSEIGLSFQRKYVYGKDSGKISFETHLSIKNEDYHNKIDLMPVMSMDMLNMLKEAGFEKTELFGGFDEKPYTEDSFLLVAKAYR